MANNTELKAAIAQVIKTNGNQEITGQVLQNTLNSIINALGAGATFKGIAVPSTNPGSPDQNVFYFALQEGTYTNFGAAVVPQGLSLLHNIGGSWASANVMILAQELGDSTQKAMSQDATTKAIDNEKKRAINAMTEYNISVLSPTGGYKEDGSEGGNLYDLTRAITALQNWLNAQVGSSQIIKGTVLKFSDRNNHDVVSFEFLGGTVTDVTNWNALPFFRYVSNDEFLKAVVDANGILLFGIRYDGTIYQSDIDDKTKNALAKVNIFIEDEFAKFKEYVTEEFEKIERVFDGGYPETLYGGARTINCGTI